MKISAKLLIIFSIVLSSMIQSCRSEETRQYDVYRVDVNTFLNVRTSPSKNAKVIERLDNGTMVEVIEIQDGWAKLKINGDQPAFVASEYLSLVKKHTGVTDASLTSETSETPLTSDIQDTIESISSDTITAPQSALKTEITFTDSINVYFMGDTTMLSSLERSLIYDRLAKTPEYIFIINTVPHIATDAIFDYAQDLLNKLTDDMDKPEGVRKNMKSWYGGEIPSSRIILLSYIKDCALLQAEGNGNALRNLKTTHLQKYLQLQLEANEEPALAISSMGAAVVQAGKAYDTQTWLMKSQTQSSYIWDCIGAPCISHDLLPHDTILYKWVLSWLLALPVKLINFVVQLVGSVPLALLILVLVNVLLYFSTIVGNHRDSDYEEGCLAQLAHIGNIFMWCSIACMVLYLVPDMSNLVVMEQSGYPTRLLSIAKAEYLTGAPSKNITILLIALVGILLAAGIQPLYALNATLSDLRQQTLWENQKLRVMSSVKKSVLKHSDLDTILQSKKPFTNLFIRYFINVGIIRTFYIWTPLAFVCSGTALLYVVVVAWTLAAKKLLTVAVGALSYYRDKMY